MRSTGNALSLILLRAAASGGRYVDAPSTERTRGGQHVEASQVRVTRQAAQNVYPLELVTERSFFDASSVGGRES